MHCTCTNVIALGLSIVLFWTGEPIGAAEVIVPDEMKNSTIQVSTGLPPQPYKDEWRRSCPDFLVFHPAPDGNPRWEDDDFCVLSEHFIVVPMEGNRLLATWTSHGPRLAFSRIMVARSENGGQSWGTPSVIAGGPGCSARWSVMVVSPRGRVYLFFCTYPHGAGKYAEAKLTCRTSDDSGKTWSEATALPLRSSTVDAPNRLPHFIAWRQPEWDLEGRPLLGFTRVGTNAKLTGRHVKRKWCQSECFRIDNLDQAPDPADLVFSYLPADVDDALTVPQPDEPEISWANEPSFVSLPDGRAFVAMRTRTGRLYYSVGAADGTFSQPAVMRYCDDGAEILQPGSPALLFRLDRERYLLVFNNNDGTAFGAAETHDSRNRRPCYLALGRFTPQAHQPLRFSDPLLFLDNDGIPLDVAGNEPRYEAAAYGSLTPAEDGYVLWYPDRKHFLLGKRIPEALLRAMEGQEDTHTTNSARPGEVR